MTPCSVRASGARSTGPTHPRILWIDDEVEPDDPTVRLLALEGFRIDVVRSAVEGLARARAGAYDAVLLDLRLQDMFGLSVLERLVAEEAAVPVLVITGYYHEPEMEARAMQAGAAAFRHKPVIDTDDLVSVLRSVILSAKEGGKPPSGGSRFGIAGSSPAIRSRLGSPLRPGGKSTGQCCDPPASDDLRRALAALDEHHWNQTVAARQLGVSRSTLYRWLRRYGLAKRSDNR